MSQQVAEPTFVAHLPSRRVVKSFVTWPPFKGSQQQQQQYPTLPPPKYPKKTKFLDHQEYNRRDNIIKAHYSKCTLKAGDRVRPMDEEVFKKNGWYKVIGVCKDWNEYCGSEEDETKVRWPENDVPMIVNAVAENEGQGACVATYMYFRRAWVGEK